MGDIFHCPEYLNLHPLMSEYPSSLSLLSDRDYGDGSYFKGYDIPSIDLDSYEKSIEGSNDCTADGVIGIAETIGKDVGNKRLLITELRMGYENCNNLSFSNIMRKYNHSCDILRFKSCDCKIDNKFALIFKPKVVAQARRLVFSWSKESSKRAAKYWSVLCPESFCNYINYGKEPPLKPTEKTVGIVDKWKENKSLTSFEQFNDLISEMRNYLYEMKNKYLIADLKYIEDHISVLLDSISFPSGDDGELSRWLVNDFRTEFFST